MIDPNETLGQVAVTHPEATRVFLRHGLDFCCGGRRRLADACQSLGLEPKEVIAEIVTEVAPGEPQRWDHRPMDELIDHILLRYHQPLRHDLPALIAAAARVERVHRDKPSCPHGLSALLSQVHAELLEHMVKEEKVLFPAILAGRVGSRVQMPVTVMMQEHDDHAVNLQKLCELTGDHRVPPEACATWRALYEALERLDTELKEHIHLENNVLFPRALAS